MTSRLFAAGLALFLALSLLPSCVCTGRSGTDAANIKGFDSGTPPGTDMSVLPGTDGGSCVSTNAMATQGVAPVDIIWVVDSSGSMSDEEAEVQNGLNLFSTFIDSTSIDYHVILIGDANSMNVPAPLGTSSRFLHVNSTVGSNNALEKIFLEYPNYASFLRPTAVTHFVVVTDDESEPWTANDFGQCAVNGVGSLCDYIINTVMVPIAAPAWPLGYTFHAVCSDDSGCVFGICGMACQNGLIGMGAAEPGLEYISLVNATGGVWQSICSTNWGPIFTALGQAVSTPMILPCVYEIPPPPMNMTLQPGQVNVVFSDSSGNNITIPNVGSAAGCAGGVGWYYDDPVNPAQVIVCGNTCSLFQNDPGGSVEIAFGCETFIL